MGFSVLAIQKNYETHFSAELLSKDHISLMDVEMKFSVPLWRIICCTSKQPVKPVNVYLISVTELRREDKKIVYK